MNQLIFRTVAVSSKPKRTTMSHHIHHLIPPILLIFCTFIPFISCDTSQLSTQPSPLPASVTFLLISLLLTLSLLLSYATHSIRSIPKTLLSTSLGLILSIILYIFFPTHTSSFQIDPVFFFEFLLPTIIFFSGYQLDRLRFYENIGSIVLMAVVNTLGSALILTIILLLALPWREAMLFGSILAAIDPVATVSLLLELEFDENVTTVLYGESVLNDAVVLVLFKAVADITKHPTLNLRHMLFTILNFGWIVAGSIVVGILLSLLTAVAFKYISFRKYPPIEVGLFLVACYMPYVVAEAVGLSGIFAILTGAILNGHYANKNLSQKAGIAVDYLFETISELAESLVFIYMGLALFAFDNAVNVWLILVTFVACVVSRGLSTIPLVKGLINPMRTHKISNPSLAVMWFSNLRGAICFCLTLDFPLEDFKDQIRTTSLVIVLLTISIFGGGLYPFLKLMEQYNPLTHHAAPNSSEELMQQGAHTAFSDDEDLESGDESKYAITIDQQKRATASFFSRLDDQYLRPWLCHREEHQVISLSGPSSTHSRPGMPEYFGISVLDDEDEVADRTARVNTSGSARQNDRSS